jgi:hypothetical protein
MCKPEARRTGKKRDIASVPRARTRKWYRLTGRSAAGPLCILTLICLIVLASAATVLGRSAQDDEGYDRINRQGLNAIDQINEALHRWSRTFLTAAGVLFAIATMKIIGPSRVYHGIHDRRLMKAVSGVDDLLKRIQAEAETNASEAKEGPVEAGLLMGMAEIAEFSQAEQVPAYVLTVNDLMLDNIRLTLRRLQGLQGGNADRYRNYMFSVVKGIKTITEESLRVGVPSGLAIDVKEYFRDDARYRAWEKLLRRVRRRGEHAELAESFLLFLRNVREGHPLIVPEKTAPPMASASAASAPPTSKVPQSLNERALAVLQQAAAAEASHLVSLVRRGRSMETQDPACLSWQFEFVHRQQQLHLREEAEKMLAVYLDAERKRLPHITGTRMLPCRTWPHILHMLGVVDGPSLQKRADNGWLTIPEILILQKAFLQTFVRKESLEHVYGRGADAELMMNLHTPQIRRETLVRYNRKLWMEGLKKAAYHP